MLINRNGTKITGSVHAHFPLDNRWQRIVHRGRADAICGLVRNAEADKDYAVITGGVTDMNGDYSTKTDLFSISTQDWTQGMLLINLVQVF